VRFLAISAAVLSCAVCQADHLILMPLGKKVPHDVVRIGGNFLQYDPEFLTGYLDIGINSYFDGSIRTDSVPGSNRNATFDLGYNYISPLTDASPGISVGVMDGLDRTKDGRRFYLSATYRVGLGGAATTFLPAEISIAATAGKKSTAMVGFMLPVTNGFRIMAEHDGYRVNAGFEMRPYMNVGFRYVFIGSIPQIGASFQTKF